MHTAKYTFQFILLAKAILLSGCFSHGTLARISNPEGEPFAGTRFALLDLAGKTDSTTEYSVPAWLIIKTWNTVDVPVSLFWDTLFLPHDIYTLDYKSVLPESPTTAP